MKNSEPSDLRSIGGAIVTFHPDLHFEHRLGAIAREVTPLIVVDNTADASTQTRLRAACAIHGAELITNSENCGLATALNQAFTILNERGLVWAVAFDQDSTPESGFKAALFATASTAPSCAVAGANWHDEAGAGVASRHLRRHPFIPLGFERQAAIHDLTDVTCVITSGSLFNLSTWRELGGFDEALFLDLVDTDFCLRARNAGHTIAVAAKAGLTHRRGSKQPVRALGRTWWPAFMPPVRLRYLFRNRIRLVWRHGWRTPHWVAFEVIYIAKIFAEIIFLENSKLRKFSACIQGSWDGLIGRKGRIRSE